LVKTLNANRPCRNLTSLHSTSSFPIIHRILNNRLQTSFSPELDAAEPTHAQPLQAYGRKEDWQRGLDLQVRLTDVTSLRLYYGHSGGDETLAETGQSNLPP